MHNFLLFAISPYLLQVTSAMPTESDCLVSVNTETFCIADQDILFIFMYYFKSNVKFLNCLLSNKIIKEPLNKMDKCTEIHKTTDPYWQGYKNKSVRSQRKVSLSRVMK